MTASACASGSASATAPDRSVPIATQRAATPAPGAASAAAAPTGRTAVVQLGDHFYDPAALTVSVGTTLTWRLMGSQTHNVIAYDGSFRSPDLGPGNSYSYTFTKPGRFPYFCAPHYGDGMTGEVIVRPD